MGAYPSQARAPLLRCAGGLASTSPNVTRSWDRPNSKVAQGAAVILGNFGCVV